MEGHGTFFGLRYPMKHQGLIWLNRRITRLQAVSVGLIMITTTVLLFMSLPAYPSVLYFSSSTKSGETAANITCIWKAPIFGYFFSSIAGDITGDGLVDIIMADPNTDTFYVYETVNEGIKNTFNISVSVLGGGGTNQMDIADVDSNSLLEFMHVSSGDVDNHLRVFHNDSEVYSADVGHPSSWRGEPVVVKAGDYDNDGAMEILVGGYLNGTISTWEWPFATGSNQFNFSVQAPRVMEIDVADIDSDSEMEVITGDWGVQIWECVDGQMVAISNLTHPSPDMGAVQSISIADLDNDGDPNLEVLACSTGFGIQTTIFKKVGETYTTVFNCSSSFYHAGSVSSAAGDIDDDGDIEFVIAEEYPDEDGISLLRLFEYESGDWQEAANYSFTKDIMNWVYNMQIIDGDNDGDDDIVVNPRNEPVQILEYTPAVSETPPPTTTPITGENGFGQIPLEWLSVGIGVPVILVITALVWKLRKES